MSRRSSVITNRITELHERGVSIHDITDQLNQEFRDELGDKRLTDRGVKSMISTYESNKEPEPGQEPPVVEIATTPQLDIQPWDGMGDTVPSAFLMHFVDPADYQKEDPSLADDLSLDRSNVENTKTRVADSYREYLGTTWDSNKAMKYIDPGNTRSVVAVGDFHGRPNRWITQRVIEADPDIIVVGGDMLDSKQATPHPDTNPKTSLTMREEVANCRAFLETICEHTHAEILVMRGNHDDWLSRKLADADLLWIMDLYGGEPLRLIVQGIPRTTLVDTHLYLKVATGEVPPEVFAKTPYLLALGDAMLSHINFSAKQPGAGVQKFSEWIYEWHRTLGLPEPSLCIQFHGHKSSLNSKQGGWLRLVEPGMAGDTTTEDYKVSYQGSWNPGTLDGCYFEQELVGDEWRTVQGSVRLLSSR